MKKLSLLLAIFVFMSTTQLSLAVDPITADRVTVSPVDYKSTQTLTYHQQEPIEIDKIRNNKEVVLVMDTSSEMSSLLPHEQGPLDSALFSGGDSKDLTSSSSTLNINGNVHSNSGVQIQAATTIEGTVSAVNTVSIPSSSTPTVKEHVARIEMDDYSAYFKAEAEAFSTKFSTDVDYLAPTPIQWYKKIINDDKRTFRTLSEFSSSDNLTCEHSVDGNGKVTWSVYGNDLILKKDRPLFFDGDLVLANGSITGDGFIVATGNITIYVGSYTTTGVGIYSVEGNVDIHTNKFNIEGFVYAPAQNGTGGNINFHGNAEVLGSIIANNISLEGGNLNLEYKVTAAHEDALKYQNISKHITIAKLQANNFIKELAKYDPSDIKMSVITYGDKAEIIGTGFYNIKADKELLIDEVNKIKIVEVDAATPVGSNLGDGLRKAYYMLQNSYETADKYIVVLSGSEPNKWTEGSDLGSFKINNTNKNNVDDVSDPAKLISSLGKDNAYKDEKAFDYARVIGGMIKGSTNPIKSFFLDIKADDILKGITGDTGITEEPGGIVATPGAIALAAGADVYNPEATEVDGKKYLFDDMLLKNLGSDIAADVILKEASYVNPLVTATFTDIIPADVEVRVYPSDLLENIPETDGTTSLTLKDDATINIIDKVGTKDKILVKLQDIEIRVKYNAKGTIIYDPTTITYTITNPATDAITNPETNAIIGTRSVGIKETKVDVGWVIDIN